MLEVNMICKVNTCLYKYVIFRFHLSQLLETRTLSLWIIKLKRNLEKGVNKVYVICEFAGYMKLCIFLTKTC
ncbi:hypothetical protein A4A49_09787 [Nicotiana attenuata]|uniref:Uncharacterized protein n=1 Tax=Nicotiana attenuata TaxID=49451 RepID=A0A1J6JIK5_NICAT|nr:hypothetical protein A4A49_09787 [Nicotiana attenuata]